ncbi:class I SAM-dependent methyltransferase, partial [candidate division WOR-3 bacterium]|nr:class I SAM-dependent methyltransferase [candidate division WOR-3 bacterium]
MKIGKLEKIFVNRRKEAEKSIKIAERLFRQIDLSNVKKVLEVGCGIGVVSSYLAKRYGWNVTGIDLDPEQIERAKKDNTENEYLRFFEADVTQLPFEDREFDMILSFDVLHHICN